MKKILSMLSAMFIAISTLTLSSCDKDELIGYDLQGTWEGKIYSSYEYDGMVRNVSYSEVEFYSNPYTNKTGTGYWVDHYTSGGQYYSSTTYEVRGGVIYIHFNRGGGDIQIRNFRLDNNYFAGSFYEDDNLVSDFSLKKTSAYYDYDYDYYSSYAKTTRSASDSTSFNVENPVRRNYKK